LDLSLEEMSPSIPCQIEQIKQVIRHLIVNAAHAIEDRGDDHEGKISVRLSHNNNNVTLEIEDNGCGIEPAHIERIYDVLFTTKEPGRGTGQGLALSHMIVTRGHAGQINVRSEPGQGTCFSISLPLVQVECDDQATERKAPILAA
jgi:signal transduction histidine kinase